MQRPLKRKIVEEPQDERREDINAKRRELLVKVDELITLFTEKIALLQRVDLLLSTQSASLIQIITGYLQRLQEIKAVLQEGQRDIRVVRSHNAEIERLLAEITSSYDRSYLPEEQNINNANTAYKQLRNNIEDLEEYITLSIETSNDHIVDLKAYQGYDQAGSQKDLQTMNEYIATSSKSLEQLRDIMTNPNKTPQQRIDDFNGIKGWNDRTVDLLIDISERIDDDKKVNGAILLILDSIRITECYHRLVRNLMIDYAKYQTDDPIGWRQLQQLDYKYRNFLLPNGPSFNLLNGLHQLGMLPRDQLKLHSDEIKGALMQKDQANAESNRLIEEYEQLKQRKATIDATIAGIPERIINLEKMNSKSLRQLNRGLREMDRMLLNATPEDQQAIYYLQQEYKERIELIESNLLQLHGLTQERINTLGANQVKDMLDGMERRSIITDLVDKYEYLFA